MLVEGMMERVASGLHRLPFLRDVLSTNLFSLEEGKLSTAQEMLTLPKCTFYSRLILLDATVKEDCPLTPNLHEVNSATNFYNQQAVQESEASLAFTFTPEDCRSVINTQSSFVQTRAHFLN